MLYNRVSRTGSKTKDVLGRLLLRGRLKINPSFSYTSELHIPYSEVPKFVTYLVHHLLTTPFLLFILFG